MRYKILVVWKNGETEILQQGDEEAVFTSRAQADEQVGFMKMGMEDEVQSINSIREGEVIT